jgi:hypothetical protein
LVACVVQCVQLAMAAPRLGIELFDGTTRISTFVVPEATAKEPFCLGRQGQVILPFEGVLPVHAVFVFSNGRLWAASASERHPAFVGVDAIPTSWVEIDVRSSIKIGRVTVRPFLIHERARTLTPYSQPTVIVRRRERTIGERIARDWERASTAVKLLCATIPVIALLLVIAR